MTWYENGMRPAAIVCLVLFACTARPSASPQERPPLAQPEPAPTPVETAPAAAVPPSPAIVDAPVRAYESIERRAEIRAILLSPGHAKWRGIYRGAGGGVRLRPDGPAFGAHDGLGVELGFDVFESKDDRARMIINHRGVRWLGWVDHADFVPQPQQELVLASAPGRVPADGIGRIEIAPGELVNVLSTRDDWHEVELPRRGVHGWVPVATFAPVFAKGGFPVRRQGFAGNARRRTRVYDRPGGKKTIWRLPAEGDTEVGIVRETKGWLEIEMVLPCDDTFRVTGFVRKGDVHDVFEQGGGGFGCGHADASMSLAPGDDAIDVRLPEGTELFDEVGQLIGVAHKHNVLRRTPDGKLQIHSRWGPIPVVAEVEATPLPPP
jgi:hypothetical protein